MAQILPTKTAVEAAFNRYAALCRVVANDPELVADADQQAALDRAEKRWTEAYYAWCANG
jgi:hypothetical protein